MIGWRSQLEINPNLSEIDEWPSPSPDQFRNDQHRRQYYFNRRLTKCVLEGARVDVIASHYNVSVSKIYYLLRRCLSSDEDSSPALSLGLIPEQRIKEYSRQAPLPTDNSQGASGSLGKLLQSENGLKEYLDNLIKRDLKSDRSAQRLTPKVFQKNFESHLEGVQNFV